MSVIDRHIEYLLQRHDCVVVPGLGAFLCRYDAARFDENGVRIMPPGRRLAFNRWLSEGDRMLVASVARGERISVERATQLVESEVEQLIGAARRDGEAPVGGLGMLYVAENDEIAFEPSAVAGINGAFYGLLPIAPMTLAERQAATEAARQRVAPVADVTADEEEGKARRLWTGIRAWRSYASGAVATLAVIVTLALFVASPIRIEKNTQTASIAPVAQKYTASCATDAGTSSEGWRSLLCGNVEGVSRAVPDALSYVQEYTAPVETPAVAEQAATALAEEAAAKIAPAPAMGAEARAAVKAAEAVAAPKSEPSGEGVRFNAEDPYCVVVASFPTESQAKVFIAQHASSQLGVVEMDGRYRVYAATGRDYASATAMAKRVGQKDAWVCRR